MAGRRLAAHRDRRRRRLRLLALTLAVIAATGVAVFIAGAWSQQEYAPTGQVVAVVNGREITTLDLQAEARATGVAYDPQAQTALLTKVVDRTLLAQEARRQHLDEVRTYPADKVRSDDVLLARQLTFRAGGVGAPISGQDVNAYMAAHPALYAQRSLLRLRQLRFEADPATFAKLATATSFNALQQTLSDLGAPVSAALLVTRSTDLAPDMADALMRLPAGGVLIVRQGREGVASTVESREAQPLNDSDAFADASERLQRERALARVTDELALLRRDAKIVYQVSRAP